MKPLSRRCLSLLFLVIAIVTGFPSGRNSGLRTQLETWRKKREGELDQVGSWAPSGDQRWEEQQRIYSKLKQLKEQRGRHSDELQSYNSYYKQWFAKWSQNPEERRLLHLDLDLRSRYGFPLSQPLKSRSKVDLTGYYQDLDVAGKME